MSLITYDFWLKAKRKRRLAGTWECDCGNMPDVIHSAEFDTAFLREITGIRRRAALYDVNIVDNTGDKPKGD